MKEKLTKEQEEYILKNYHNNQTWKIAEDLNVDKEIIYKFLKKKNLKKDNKAYSIQYGSIMSIQKIYNYLSKSESASQLSLSSFLSNSTLVL